MQSIFSLFFRWQRIAQSKIDVAPGHKVVETQRKPEAIRARPHKDSRMQARSRMLTYNLPRATPGWSDVLQWAADDGLDSPEALRQWINEMAPRGQYSVIDPRAALLLQRLRNYSMASPRERNIQALPSSYNRLLKALSEPGVGSRYNKTTNRYDYPPGIDGPEWIRPLVDPLAEGGRLWPPSPATVLVRMNEIANRAYGYGPIDSYTMKTDLIYKDYPDDESTIGDMIAYRLSNFGEKIAKALPGGYGARIDPTAPKLASDVDIAEARRRWPLVDPYAGIQKPYILAVSPAIPLLPDDLADAASAVRAVLISQGGLPVRVLLVSDATGDIINFGGLGVFRPRLETDWETITNDANRHRIMQASGNDQRLVVDIMMPFVRAVREGWADAAGMVPMNPDDQPGFERTHGAPRVAAPYMVRAFEPAEVLGALLAARRAAAAAAINEAAASAGGLANLAARAYRGDIETANAPEEVRQLLAAQALARACTSSGTAPDRRTLEAARVLGVSQEARRGGDLTALCEVSAEVARRLYGDA
nr:hypothetical protein [Pandoravirus massiliensis]